MLHRRTVHAKERPFHCPLCDYRAAQVCSVSVWVQNTTFCVEVISCLRLCVVVCFIQPLICLLLFLILLFCFSFPLSYHQSGDMARHVRALHSGERQYGAFSLMIRAFGVFLEFGRSTLHAHTNKHAQYQCRFVLC